MIARKGASEAGAVFIRILIQDDQVRLLGPQPGATYNASGDRNWHSVFGAEPVCAQQADEYLSKQIGYDPDIWIIDIDDRTGTALLDISDS